MRLCTYRALYGTNNAYSLGTDRVDLSVFRRCPYYHSYAHSLTHMSLSRTRSKNDAHLDTMWPISSVLGVTLILYQLKLFKPRAQSLVIQFQNDKNLMILMPISVTFLLSKACLKVSSKTVDTSRLFSEVNVVINYTLRVLNSNMILERVCDLSRGHSLTFSFTRIIHEV